MDLTHSRKRTQQHSTAKATQTQKRNRVVEKKYAFFLGYFILEETQLQVLTHSIFLDWHWNLVLL